MIELLCVSTTNFEGTWALSSQKLSEAEAHAQQRSGCTCEGDHEITGISVSACISAPECWGRKAEWEPSGWVVTASGLAAPDAPRETPSFGCSQICVPATLPCSHTFVFSEDACVSFSLEKHTPRKVLVNSENHVS